MSRAFTYNNGPLIPNTDQVGDLAIQIPGLPFSGNLGGKTWWGGPLETNYIIAKDVPTQDWPAKGIPAVYEGNVNFWGTNEKTDSKFISLTNYISGDSFTTVSQSLTYLSSSGYWNNYPTPASLYLFANLSVGSVGGSGIQFNYSPSTNEVIGYVISANNYILDLSTIISGSNTISSPTRFSEGGPFTLNYLGTEAYISNNGNNQIKKYSTSNQSLLDTYTGIDFDAPGEFSSVVYVSASNKIAGLSRGSGLGQSNPTYINIVDSSFTSDSNVQFTNPSNTTNSSIVEITSNFDNDKILARGLEESNERYYIVSVDNSNIYKTVVWNTSTYDFGWGTSTNIKNGGWTVCHPTNNDWYCVGKDSDDADSTIKILVIDATDETDFAIKDLITLPSSGTLAPQWIVYDENIDAVWTLNANKELVAVSCVSHTITKNAGQLPADLASAGSKPTIDPIQNYLLIPGANFSGIYIVDLSKISYN